MLLFGAVVVAASLSNPFGNVLPGSVQGYFGPGFAFCHHQSRSICGLTSGGGAPAIVVA